MLKDSAVSEGGKEGIDSKFVFVASSKFGVAIYMYIVSFESVVVTCVKITLFAELTLLSFFRCIFVWAHDTERVSTQDGNQAETGGEFSK